jgi:hypothetical protein
VGFVVDKIALIQIYLRILCFAQQFHSTNAPYSYSPSELLLTEEQTGEAWGHSKKCNALSEIVERQFKKKVLLSVFRELYNVEYFVIH